MTRYQKIARVVTPSFVKPVLKLHKLKLYYFYGAVRCRTIIIYTREEKIHTTDAKTFFFAGKKLQYTKIPKFV